MNPFILFAVAVLGATALAAWIGAVVCMLRALGHRRQGRSVLEVAGFGMFQDANFTVQGNRLRVGMIRFMIVCLAAVAGMVAVSLAGVMAS